MTAPQARPLLDCRHLPTDERIRRIGALICRIARSLPNEPHTDEQLDALCAPQPDESAPEMKVLGYLRKISEASPAEIRATVGLSRSTTYRTLQRLHSQRRVTCHGRTKALVYRIPDIDPSRN